MAVETLNNVLERNDEFEQTSTSRKLQHIHDKPVYGLYFNILTWSAYRKATASEMLASGDAAITTNQPARDAIHYYPLIPRTVCDIMLDAPIIKRIYIPGLSPAKYDAVTSIRAAFRDGSLARIINKSSTLEGEEKLVVSDARPETLKNKHDGSSTEFLFVYDELSRNKKIHKDGEVLESDPEALASVMMYQMAALREALFYGRSQNVFYMFPHMNLLLCDTLVGRDDVFVKRFYNPLDGTMVCTRVDAILNTLRIDQQRQMAYFANERMFRIKKVRIRVKLLYERQVENNSMSGRSLVYRKYGKFGEERNAESEINLDQAIVFAIPPVIDTELARATFNLFVGIKSTENIVFVSTSVSGAQRDLSRMDSELLEIDDDWPDFFIVRPAILPVLDLHKTTNDINDPDNFKTVVKFIK
jgi:hypothetical protein